ncbi:hypothetical protein Pyrde_1092 [Pyrodictium delaneyi]|uniref:C2H2-type domain-containing protein n=1 Tax=Pyrodictium delaneyi TaxID=1273541 RepID=A0A0P0N2K0_9CREN|nr:hypothetical protein [Pyrodictium delaneyi]ALL01140.1 hypothetical protein Pyrde_1092 [Pyrodictium delaneyi]OWJ55284.1 hypothetical protein Pdsh_00175 [Pyrodictium delaneyi]
MGYARLDLLYVVGKLSEAAIRKATGLSYSLNDIPRSLQDAGEEIVERVAEQLVVDDNDTLRCRICGRGPFTRKGLYLHIRRVHLDTVYDIVKSELEAYLWRLRNT